MSRFPLSRGIFAGNLNVVRGAEVLTQWRVGEVRSSILVSTVHRKISSRPLSRQMGKRERQASAASCYTSLKTGFFDCCYLVLFDSVLLPTQAFCSSSISAQFSNTLSPQNLILLKLPVENSDSRRIESKIPPPTQLSSSSQSYDSQSVSLNSSGCPGVSCLIQLLLLTDGILLGQGKGFSIFNSVSN